MTFLRILVAVATFITPLTLAAKMNQPLKSDIPPETSTLSFDSFTMKNLFPPPRIGLELPLNGMETKFQKYDIPATFLKPPPLPQLMDSASSPNYYEIPSMSQIQSASSLPSIPADILKPPPLMKGFWAPESEDSKLYYELPKTITGEILPTNKFPKKFNKELHIKQKPFAFTPKEEIILDPIDEIEYNSKQKQVHKLFDIQNKKKNQDIINLKKVPLPISNINDNNHEHHLTFNNENENNLPLVIINPPLSLTSNHNITSLIHNHQALPSSSSYNSPDINNSNSNPLQPSITASASSLSSLTNEQENDTDESKEHDDDDDVDDHNNNHSSEKNEEDVENDKSEEQTDQSDDHKSSTGSIKKLNGEDDDGERTMFHMVGFDGPMSYKWGFDTGKGPNRQFRYEERDREGIVKGHFGYYDQSGKLRLTNYKNHPVDGLQMEPVKENDDSS